MKNELKNQILENFNRYKEVIVAHLQEYDYKKERYKVDFTLALFLAKEKIDTPALRKYIRYTDKLIALDTNLLAVVFDFTNEEKGLKAAENVLSIIEPSLSSYEIYISVVNSRESLDDGELARKALNLLIENIENGFKDIPEVPL